MSPSDLTSTSITGAEQSDMAEAGYVLLPGAVDNSSLGDSVRMQSDSEASNCTSDAATENQAMQLSDQDTVRHIVLRYIDEHYAGQESSKKPAEICKEIISVWPRYCSPGSNTNFMPSRTFVHIQNAMSHMVSKAKQGMGTQAHLRDGGTAIFTKEILESWQWRYKVRSLPETPNEPIRTAIRRVSDSNPSGTGRKESSAARSVGMPTDTQRHGSASSAVVRPRVRLSREQLASRELQELHSNWSKRPAGSELGLHRSCNRVHYPSPDPVITKRRRRASQELMPDVRQTSEQTPAVNPTPEPSSQSVQTEAEAARPSSAATPPHTVEMPQRKAVSDTDGPSPSPLSPPKSDKPAQTPAVGCHRIYADSKHVEITMGEVEGRMHRLLSRVQAAVQDELGNPRAFGDAQCAANPSDGVLWLYRKLLDGNFELATFEREVTSRLTNYDFVVALVGAFMQSHVVFGIRSPNPGADLAKVRNAMQPFQPKLDEICNSLNTIHDTMLRKAWLETVRQPSYQQATFSKLADDAAFDLAERLQDHLSSSNASDS